MCKAIEIKVECPFFCSENTKTIICEGVKSKAKELYFFRDADQKKWLRSICCDDYKSCSRYKTLIKKYGG